MSNDTLTQSLTRTVEKLAEPELLRDLCHQQRDGSPLPSGTVLHEIIELSRAILFPGYYGNPNIHFQTVKYQLGVSVERLYLLLTDQIWAGLCFCEDCDEEGMKTSDEQREMAETLSLKLIERLPQIRETLATDVLATYNGDPAAKSHAEIIACYPVIKALANYRIAHELYNLEVPIIPRMITEMGHSETGIDIHPRATIGQYFTIDHGTGTVVGATCVIGNNVKLYQGVTLGAKSFPLDDNGNPIKGIPRHPILEDNVIVYANATILGRITVGKGSVVGANVWVTHDIDPNTKIFNRVFED
ncbi:MAG: serine O-acetyltransferase EpsC [Prevotella sp.]